MKTWTTPTLYALDNNSINSGTICCGTLEGYGPAAFGAQSTKCAVFLGPNGLTTRPATEEIYIDDCTGPCAAVSTFICS